MIDFRDGQITDPLNNGMKYNPETVAIGYAILCEKQRILALAEKTYLMSAIEKVDENVLDYLAVELRTQAYKDTFPLPIKQALVAGTLMFYTKLGTPAAVEWIIRSFFGSGHLLEWFEYGGAPNYFRIILEDQPPAEHKQEFMAAIELVKRKSQWLEKIIVLIKAIAQVHIAFCSHKFDFRARSNVFGLQIVRLDGSHRLDGTWLLSTEWTRGAKVPRIALRYSQNCAPSLRKVLGITSHSFYMSGIKTKEKLRVRKDSSSSRSYQVHISAGIEAGGTASAQLTADSMWRLDGEYLLDGSRRLNAAITTTKL